MSSCGQSYSVEYLCNNCLAVFGKNYQFGCVAEFCTTCVCCGCRAAYKRSVKTNKWILPYPLPPHHVGFQYRHGASEKALTFS